MKRYNFGSMACSLGRFYLIYIHRSKSYDAYLYIKDYMMIVCRIILVMTSYLIAKVKIYMMYYRNKNLYNNFTVILYVIVR